jgi:folate-binding protein YgfZ
MSILSDVIADEHEVRGTFAVRGADAAKFLQGQLSADVDTLPAGASAVAGLHNPQGRVIALLAVTRAGAADFELTLPRELLDPVMQRLRKYVLRAKVRIEESPELPPAVDSLAAVRAGMPEVYAATSEAFVAQMLNLDLLGAIAFDKGCYTGQEVIARAHYRGRVKRRTQRWLNASDTPLAPGDAARSTDGRSLIVVRTAQGEDGQEILAVGTFAAAGEPPAEGSGETQDADTAAIQVSGPLPLPYTLPA